MHSWCSISVFCFCLFVFCACGHLFPPPKTIYRTQKSPQKRQSHFQSPVIYPPCKAKGGGSNGLTAVPCKGGGVRTQEIFQNRIIFIESSMLIRSLFSCVLLAAAIARRVYIYPTTGVGGFRKVFGGNDRRGVRPGHFIKSSGGIIRHCLQQLEKMGIVEIAPHGCAKEIIFFISLKPLANITTAFSLVICCFLFYFWCCVFSPSFLFVCFHIFLSGVV